MLKGLVPVKGFRRARLDAKATERAHRQVINVFVDDPFLLPVGEFDPGRDHFDRSVRAIGFTNPAAGAPVLVVLVVGHDDLSLETVKHLQFLPVLGILLSDDLPGAEKVSSGHRHADEQGFDSPEDIS